jgi:Family of unknown function (DUF6084)
VPDLEFSVEGAEALAFAAQPTMVLKLRIAVGGGDAEVVRSVSLAVQVRIAATQRAYTPAEQERLLEVFGEPSRWGQTLKSLLWTMVSVHVPNFRGHTVVDLAIPCTYDFEVVGTKYFDALQDGHIPLELLFSGTVFYMGVAGLQAEQIGWDKEARFSLPVQVWKDVIGLYFPNSTWLRLHKDTFDRLYRYRTRHTLPTWEAALDSLLSESERQEPVWTR